MGFLVEKYILENIVRFSFEYLAQNIELQFTLCESPRPGVVQTSSKCQRCTFCTFPRACVCPWWWLGRKSSILLVLQLAWQQRKLQQMQQLSYFEPFASSQLQLHNCKGLLPTPSIVPACLLARFSLLISWIQKTAKQGRIRKSYSVNNKKEPLKICYDAVFKIQ